MCDNLMVEATGEGKERLAAVLAVCSQWKDEAPRWSAWKKHANSITLSRFKGAGFVEFPSDIDAHGAAHTAHAVLSCLGPDQWPKQPDIDGDCKRGWRVRHNNRETTIEPFWMIYHK